MTNYFIFNGESSLDYGIRVPELPPIVRAQRRTIKTTIPGRSGTYTYNEKNGDENVYESYYKAWEIVTKDDKDMARALNWLRGSGEIIFSNELNRAYKVDFAEQISLSRVFKTWRRGTVSCEVQPFKYDIAPVEFAMTTPLKVFNVETERNIPLYIRLQPALLESNTSIYLRHDGELQHIFIWALKEPTEEDQEPTEEDQKPWITIDGERQVTFFDDGRDAGLAIMGDFPLKLKKGLNELHIYNLGEAQVLYRGTYL